MTQDHMVISVADRPERAGCWRSGADAGNIVLSTRPTATDTSTVGAPVTGIDRTQCCYRTSFHTRTWYAKVSTRKWRNESRRVEKKRANVRAQTPHGRDRPGLHSLPRAVLTNSNSVTSMVVRTCQSLTGTRMQIDDTTIMSTKGAKLRATQ
jgi:hypothetical protein